MREPHVRGPAVVGGVVGRLLVVEPPEDLLQEPLLQAPAGAAAQEPVHGVAADHHVLERQPELAGARALELEDGLVGGLGQPGQVGRGVEGDPTGVVVAHIEPGALQDVAEVGVGRVVDHLPERVVQLHRAEREVEPLARRPAGDRQYARLRREARDLDALERRLAVQVDDDPVGGAVAAADVGHGALELARPVHLLDEPAQVAREARRVLLLPRLVPPLLAPPVGHELDHVRTGDARLELEAHVDPGAVEDHRDADRGPELDPPVAEVQARAADPGERLLEPLPGLAERLGRRRLGGDPAGVLGRVVLPTERVVDRPLEEVQLDRAPLLGARREGEQGEEQERGESAHGRAGASPWPRRKALSCRGGRGRGATDPSREGET